MGVSILQHKAIFTQALIKKIDEIKPERTGFSNFFPTKTYPTKYVSTQVRRAGKSIAAQVSLFSEGEKIKISKSTENIYEPPHYRVGTEYGVSTIFNLTFDQGVAPTTSSHTNMMINEVSKVMVEARNKIERARRLQESEVLQTGTVTMKNGANIDYGRKAESMIAKTAGSFWNEAGGDPLVDLDSVATFIREEGNAPGNELNVIMASPVFYAFKNNEKVKEQAEWINIRRVDIGNPKFDNGTGMSFQGQVAGTDFVYNIYTYNEYYEETLGGTKAYYLDRDKFVMLPNEFEGETSCGAVPAKEKGGSAYAKEAEYSTHYYDNDETMSEGLDILSRPLVVPHTIDMIGSGKVLA